MEQKIVFAGPVGAGKTTAISAISDIPVVRTEAGATDDSAVRRPTTTAAMDYGLQELGEGARVHLFGTPGPERFSFMWDMLTIGGMGLVLLVDNGREDPLGDLQFYLAAFEELIARNPVVIGVTRMDLSPRPGIHAFHSKLAKLGISAPVLEVDARDRKDIKLLLLSLLATLDPVLPEEGVPKLARVVR